MTDYLEPPSKVSAVYTIDHVLRVCWQPVKKSSNIEGYKVMASKGDKPWHPLTVTKKTGSQLSFCLNKGKYKIGVCSYKGNKDSNITYTEVDVKATDRKLAEEKPGKFSSRGYILQHCDPSSYSITGSSHPVCPQTKVKIKSLPYHKVLTTPIKLTALPVRAYKSNSKLKCFTVHHVIEKAKYCFCLEKKLVNHILNSRDQSFGTYGVQVLVRFCCYYNSILKEDGLPECIVRVNGELALVQKTDLEFGAPLDITKLCNFTQGKDSEDVLYIEWMAHPKKSYYVTVCVAEKLSIPDMVSKWMVDNVADPAITRKMVKDKLKSDTDVSCTSLKSTLTCPLGKTRIVSPCRGQNCTHIQCVDAVTLLKMNEGRPLSGRKCYMCDKPIGNIYIDGLYLEILASAPNSVDEIEFRHDGSWIFVGQEGVPTSGMECQHNQPSIRTVQTLTHGEEDVGDSIFGSDDKSDEQSIIKMMKSRISRIKSQVDQLELLSKQHEQFNTVVDDEKDICIIDDFDDTGDDDGDDIAVIDLSKDEVERVAHLAGTENNQVPNSNSALNFLDRPQGVRDKSHKELEQRNAEKNKILENEIAKMLQDVKDSAKKRKLTEKATGSQHGDTSDSCKGQKMKKAAEELHSNFKKKILPRTINCSNSNMAESGCVKDGGNTNEVVDIDHNSGIFRKKLDQKGLNLLEIGIEAGDAFKNDFSSVFNNIETLKNADHIFQLLKPDGTVVSSIHLSNSEIFLPVHLSVSEEECSVSETEQNAKQDKIPVHLDQNLLKQKPVDSESDGSIALLVELENGTEFKKSSGNTTSVTKTKVTESKTKSPGMETRSKRKVTEQKTRRKPTMMRGHLLTRAMTLGANEKVKRNKVRPVKKTRQIHSLLRKQLVSKEIKKDLKINKEGVKAEHRDRGNIRRSLRQRPCFSCSSDNSGLVKYSVIRSKRDERQTNCKIKTRSGTVLQNKAGPVKPLVSKLTRSHSKQIKVTYK